MNVTMQEFTNVVLLVQTNGVITPNKDIRQLETEIDVEVRIHNTEPVS